MSVQNIFFQKKKILLFIYNFNEIYLLICKELHITTVVLL